MALTAISHRTIPTSSDHDALATTYEINGRRLTVTNCNVGDGPLRAKIADTHKLAEISDVICFNEVGDRNLADLLPPGWGFRKKSRCAIAWRLATMGAPFDHDDQLLHMPTQAGPGAGPDRVGRKDIVGERFNFGPPGARELLTIGAWHLVASQHQPRRRRLARKEVAAGVKWIRRQPGHVILAGDVNNLPKSPILAPLRGLGMKALQTTKTLSTHTSRRAIDQAWHLNRPVTRPTDPEPDPQPTPPEEPPMPETPTITQRVVRRARQLGVDIYTHDEWDARYPAIYAQRRISRPVTKVKADTLVAHITVTFDSGDLVGDFFADMRTVERIGYERFGSGFSYNFGFDNDDGRVGVGQPLDAKGTHTVNDKGVKGYSYDQNAVARAFAFIGVPGNKLSAKCRLSMVRMMAAMILEGALTEDPDTVPHSLFAAKDCPTDTVRDELPAIKRDALLLVKQVLAGPRPPKPPGPVEQPETHPTPKWDRIWAEAQAVLDSDPGPVREADAKTIRDLAAKHSREARDAVAKAKA